MLEDGHPRPIIGLILLAAGESRRFGPQDKQLADFRGRSLIRHAIDQALGSVADVVVVVLGAEYEAVKKEIGGLPVETVLNEEWRKGMSSSIRRGLNYLLNKEPNLSAVVLQLCDQPLVNAGNIDCLIDSFRETRNEVIAADYNNTFGVPALFAEPVFAELSSLSEQTGAKQIISRHREAAVFLPMPEAAFDVDTPEDLQKLI